MSDEAAIHLGNIYATALFELAVDGKLADAVRNDLTRIRELETSAKDFKIFKESPYFTSEFKSTVLRKMLGGRVSDLTLDFLMIVAKRNRLTYLPEISDAYATLWNEHNGIVGVHVTLASESDGHEVEKLRLEIAAAIEKKVNLQVSVKPEILGGVVIRYGDMVIDNSVRGLLERAVKTIIDRNGKAQMQ